ncbi:MAG: ATP-binding cassette domain-containing protein [Candidatus Didemnitutus sp.]|nr:ATP-binding cassette domain-containing protein [Candidatus Didemnitutus sp.]
MSLVADRPAATFAPSKVMNTPITPAPVSDDSSAGQPAFDRTYIQIQEFSFYYGAAKVLHNLTFNIPERQVTAFIGPSGCGKSTLLRNLNRMNDLVDGIRHEGDILVNGHSIYDPLLEVIALRKRIGMVFQKSNPFPKSIYENVAYSLRVAGRNGKAELDEVVEKSLKGAALWDEVKDRLNESAFSLSGGQMQRLCIARAIVSRPALVLADEPTANLDDAYARDIMDMFRAFNEVGVTLVISTHDQDLINRYGGHKVTLAYGKQVV